MTFNEQDVNRESNGKFGEKTGGAPDPSVTLALASWVDEGGSNAAAAAARRHRRPRLSVIFERNASHVETIFPGTENARRFESTDKVYETSAWAVSKALQDCAGESLGRELTDDELRTVVSEKLWHVRGSGTGLETTNSGEDFHNISVWNAYLALERVRYLDG